MDVATQETGDDNAEEVTTWLQSENISEMSTNVTEEDIIRGATLVPICVLTVIANLMTIVVAYKLIKFNKNITDLFVFVLAWTDFILGLFVIPFTIVAHFTGFIPGGDPMCKFNFLVVNSTVQVSAFLILVMSFERWVAFVKPLLYKSKFTFKTAKILIGTVVVYSLLTSILPLVGVGDIGNFEYVCMVDWQTKEIDGIIMVWFQVILGMISIIAVWYFNAAVAYSVCSMRRIRKANSRQHDKHFGQAEIKFARLTACVAIVYSICWGPYLIRVVMVQTGSPKDDLVDFIVTRLAAANSMVNPIIYGAVRKSYLRGYVFVLKEWCYYLTCGKCGLKPKDETFKARVAGGKNSYVVNNSTASQHKKKRSPKKTSSQLSFVNFDENQLGINYNETNSSSYQETDLSKDEADQNDSMTCSTEIIDIQMQSMQVNDTLSNGTSVNGDVTENVHM